MAGSTGQIPGDVIDAIRPDLEAFASLWSALRTNYQGTNITKTVARLLHMYQPEDGVLAYERLLRTLYVLLEDFDGDGLRLLVSMVPPPKGVADEVIKRVFHKATGFVRLNAPIFHRNNANPESEEKGESSKTNGNSDLRANVTSSGNSRLQTVVRNAENPPEGTTILQAIVKSSDPPPKIKSPKVRPRESEVFRGFPSNEMTNSQCRATSATHFYGPSMSYPGFSSNQRFVDYREAQGPSSGSIPTRPIDPSAYRFKWLEAQNLPRKIGYDGSVGYPDLILKTADNKFIRLPITKINGPPIGGYASTYNPMKSAYQAFYPNSQIHPRPENFNSDPELSRKVTNHLRSRRRFEGSTEKSEDPRAESSTHSRTDLVDHDYGFSRPQQFSVEKETFRADEPDWPNEETMERFRDTVKNTQRAIQEDIYRMDVVRSDDIVEQTNSEEFSLDPEILTVSEELKKGASDFLKRAEEEKSLTSSGFPNTRILQNPENVKIKSSPGIRQLEGPSAPQKNVEKTDLNSVENCDKEGNNLNPVSSIKNSTLVDRNASSKIGKVGRNQTSNYQENATPIGSSSRIFADTSTIRTEMMSNHQTNSMSELVNYRKQYYDALLSIQRAKVAVANSLAISSTQNSASYDPRVFQYLQQQHQLLQHQQQRLLMGPQHPMTRQMVHPTYGNARGLWIRGSSDWKYSPCGQFAFPPQTYPMTTPSCPVQSAPITPIIDSSLPENIPRASHHLHRTSRPATKRRKLEDIVDKLRDTDDSKLN